MLYSPIAFFDSNPSGRILNRFSSDIGHIDDMLPPCFTTLLHYLLVHYLTLLLP